MIQTAWNPIRDCYPCNGDGVIRSQMWPRGFVCSNCHGYGVSPTWEMSDGSDPSKRPNHTSQDR